jgi:DNA-binding SARP family transcriptional activator
MATLTVLGPTMLLGVPDAASLLGQPRPTSLLIYLSAAHPGAFVRRDHLVTLFWPESGQEQARTNLRKLLHAVRRVLGEESIEGRGDEEVRLRPGIVECDLPVFEDDFRARRFARALERLDNTQPTDWIAVTGASTLEDWASATRIRVADMASAAAWSLAQISESGNALTDAGRWARRAFSFAPEDERRLRRVMELLARIGETAGALRLFDQFERHLHREFGARPAVESRALMERLRSG